MIVSRIEPLEPRRLMAVSYGVVDKGDGELSTARGVAGVVRVNNTYELVNEVADGTPGMQGVLVRGSKRTELVPLDGFTSAFATDMSETGITVGFSGSRRATKWIGSKPTDLGSGRLLGISNDGKQIVGTRVVKTSAGDRDHAYRFGPTVVDLGTLGGTTSRANDVNNSGIAVGQASTGTGEMAPFYHAGNLPVRIGSGTGQAFAINDPGVAVGELNGAAFSFNTKTNQLTTLPPPDLGADVTTYGALDINNAGEIVGYAIDGSSQWHAIIWKNGVATDLSSQIPAGHNLEAARTINEKGQILAITAGESAEDFDAALLLPFRASVNSKGTLVIAGTAAADAVSVAAKGSQVKVTVNGAGQSFSKTSIKRMSISLGNGNDTLALGAGLRSANVSGGAGNDLLNTLNSVADIVDGGAGRDRSKSDGGDSLSLIEDLIF